MPACTSLLSRSLLCIHTSCASLPLCIYLSGLYLISTSWKRRREAIRRRGGTALVPSSRAGDMWAQTDPDVPNSTDPRTGLYAVRRGDFGFQDAGGADCTAGGHVGAHAHLWRRQLHAAGDQVCARLLQAAEKTRPVPRRLPLLASLLERTHGGKGRTGVCNEGEEGNCGCQHSEQGRMLKVLEEDGLTRETGPSMGESVTKKRQEEESQPFHMEKHQQRQDKKGDGLFAGQSNEKRSTGDGGH